MESEELIPRPYQVELEEIAVQKNTIIHLPTGSGKTFIAIRLIKRLKHSLQLPWGQGGKRTFFLVNNVPLVDQQKRVISRLCPVSGVGGYSSEDGIDYWNKAKWDEELSANQVIVMTCQILVDMLTHKYIEIEDINLFIFDECHHAVDDHPMRRVMKHFETCPVDKQPRVLGLTATLLNSNASPIQVQGKLKDLETTFHATIATVNEIGEVLNYSTNPHEVVLYYSSPTLTRDGAQAIELLNELAKLVFGIKLPQKYDTSDVKLQKGQKDITTDPKKTVKAVNNMITSMINFIKELGTYGGAVGILAYIILLERLKRKALTKQEETFYKVVITHLLEARMVLLDSMKNESGYDKIKKHSSEQILQILDILKEYNPERIKVIGVLMKINKTRQPLSAIIFTRQRFTAKVLYNILKDAKEANPQEFGFLEHDFVVGFNINPLNNTREQYFTKKTSQLALLRFGNKELNCLIATSVIEEGIDIPQCGLVLRYDPPLEYRSYIQCKGRARSANSSFVLLVNESSKKKFLEQYKGFQTTEQYIQSILVGSQTERAAPTSDDILENLYEEDLIPPFITENGHRLSSVSAISLLSRYCSLLPHDQFTCIVPRWIHEKKTINNNTYDLITIIMPIACSIKEPIQSTLQPNKKNAKRSAALNVCKRLYEEGELDSETLLPHNFAQVDFEQSDVKNCFPNWPKDAEANTNEGVPKAGTKKRVRKHEKVFPSCLNGPEDWKFGRQTLYLHVIKLQANFPEPKESRERALYKLLNRDEGYGLLTFQKLPQLCSFPMFLTVGEVSTSLEVNHATVQLDLTMFDLVKQFHFFIFDQVLAVANKFISFDGKVNAIYAVPLKKNSGCNIDWEFMKTYKNIPPIAVPTFEERRCIEVSRETYQYSVVTPWYRGILMPDRYIVSDVLEYMTQKTRFDGDSFCTYEDYYLKKYNLQLVGDENQPLLEVRNISTRMNCLLPRAATIKAFTDKQRKLVSEAEGDDKPKAFAEIFIPEYCIKYDYPGHMWYKAMMLPSIIHRIYMLLVANELREEIANQIKYGRPLSLNEEWLPIEADLQTAMKSLLSQIEQPVPHNSVDRINNPIEESTEKPQNIRTMKDTVYDIQKQKISKEYPWDEKLEPIDIERNISIVTVMDIELYDEFATSPLYGSTTPGRSPPKPTTSSSAAILPPPLTYNDKIAILKIKPNNRGPELRDVLAAITTMKSNDTLDLERVETLGDAFLKFAASLYLFHKFPALNEGQLTNIKGRLIGNRNLYYAGENARLGGRMKVEQFSPKKDFLVPGFFAPQELRQLMENAQIRPTFLIGIEFPYSEILSGQLSEDSIALIQKRFAGFGSSELQPEGMVQNSMQCYVGAQAVSDKSVADCVEALVGTYLLSGGILAATKVLEWFKVLPAQDNFAAYLNKKVPTVLSEKKTTEQDIEFLLNDCRADVERILNYKFKDPSFLLEAISHPSYIRNRYTRSYERLEFLGDAILDFLITSHIYENCQKLNPGDLTDLRSALVNNVTFASYVVKLGLHKCLCSSLNPSLDNAIINFVEHQEQRDHEIVEDVLHLIAEEDCHIAEYVDVPKVLSDIFESLVGAIYLDSEGDLQKVWSVIYRIMWKEIAVFSARIPKQPVRVLYEMIHACPVFGTPKVIDTEISKIHIPVTFTLRTGRQYTVYGVGSNKSQAKRAAAKLALKLLNV